MVKRWIIRSLFLLPVVLCLAGWGWSGRYEGWARYTRSLRWIELGTWDGAVHLHGGWDPWMSDRYEASVVRTDAVRFWPKPDADSFCFLGFRWRHFRTDDRDGTVYGGYFLAIPYWFPLLVSSLLLLGAWRKTRQKTDPATAFPVVLKT